MYNGYVAQEKLQKNHAGNLHNNCLYCAEKAVWDESYAVVVLCEHMAGDDLVEFLEATGGYCDKFIVVGDASVQDFAEGIDWQKQTQLLAYVQVERVEDRRIALWQMAGWLKVEWVCFMQSNERFILTTPLLEKKRWRL